MIKTRFKNNKKLTFFQLRSYCSVLLRRLAYRTINIEGREENLWSIVNESTQQGVKELLLSALANETDQGARHKVSDAIAEIARFDLGKGGIYIKHI